MKRWDRLFRRQRGLTKDRACAAAPEATGTLELSPSGIAHMGRLSGRLEKLTGWRIVPVAERVADEIRHREFRGLAGGLLPGFRECLCRGKGRAGFRGPRGGVRGPCDDARRTCLIPERAEDPASSEHAASRTFCRLRRLAPPGQSRWPMMAPVAIRSDRRASVALPEDEKGSSSARLKYFRSIDGLSLVMFTCAMVQLPNWRTSISS